jgi:hypothetical protein
MDFLYELEPDLKILWAHAGTSEPAMTAKPRCMRIPLIGSTIF